MTVFAIVSLLFFLVSLYAAGHALLNKRDSRSALGWVALCLLAPYAGPVLYLLFGVNRSHTSAKRLRPTAASGIRSVYREETTQAQVFPMSVVGLNITHQKLVPAEDLQILRNGDEAYPAMLAAIEKAQSQINLSTYIFSHGQIADRFISALKAAHERGVKVSILLDGMGEYMGVFRIGPRLRRADLKFLRFNPLTLLPLSLHMNLRNHRKLLIVDSRLAFTGGMNIADGNCLNEKLASHQIQDLHFSMKGPIVQSLEHSFLQDWHYAFRHARSQDDAGPVPEKPPANLPDETITRDRAWARVITDGPNVDIDKCSDTLSGIFACARKRIWIMTPYFLPDAELVGALQAACLRNIDVQIILPAENNIPAAHRASRHQLWQLLNYGVKVWYQQSPFNHSKVLLADDDYSLIGSANLDPRSLRLNFELNVELFDADTNAKLAAYCEEKIAGSRQYTRQNLRQRPLPTRLLDAICWLFSPYL